MKLTTRAIATEAGVSPATVSRYCTGSENVSPELAKKIEDALQRMGQNIELKRYQSQVVLVLLTHLRFSFYSRAIQELLDQEDSRGYSFTILRYDPRTPEPVRSFVNRMHPVGAIYFEEEIDSTILQFIQSTGVKTVMCGGVAVDPNSDMVHVNDIKAAYDGTRYLLGLGHRDILFLSDDISKIGAGYQRIAGCRKAMEESGVCLPDDSVICGSVTFDAGYEAIQKALEDKIRFTAVFAFSDELAVGAMAALHDAGLRVPEDVSILGYDDLPIALRVRPKLTTIHQPIDMFIKKTLELFDQGHQGLSTELLLQHSIVQRDSCKRRSPSDGTN